mgnify:CR=1 FL=1
MFDRLDDILIRFEELLHELGDPVLTSDPEKFRRLMKEQAELAPLVETYTQYKKTKKSIEENLELLEQERDEEMRELLKEDLAEAKKQMPELEKELKKGRYKLYLRRCQLNVVYFLTDFRLN